MLLNHTLAALGPDDQAAIFPHLTSRQVDRGEVLTVQGGKVSSLNFPATAYLANTVRFSDGRSVEAFILGREGVSGIGAWLADLPCAWAVEVASAGEIYVLPDAVLRRRFDESASLRNLLQRRAYEGQARAAMQVACASFHTATERLARLILASSRGLERVDLRITQDDLGLLIGLQRTTVNAAAQKLKEAGAIGYRRGVIRVLNREALENEVCECAMFDTDFMTWSTGPLRPMAMPPPSS